MESKKVLTEKGRGESILDLKVVYRPCKNLKPRNRNTKRHTPAQVSQIAESIRRFGFNNPLLVDPKGMVIAGHGRLAAAKQLGLDRIPTISLDQLSEAEIRAYAIADNKIAENAGWDRELLALELQYLSELEIDLDLTITGFQTAEIDILLDELHPTNSSEETELPPEVANGPAITAPGDLWGIGPHRLLCGDATKKSAYKKLLGRDRAQMVFIDPPYNVAIEGHVSGLGKNQHREFAMAAGEMSTDEFTGFLATTFKHLAAFSADGSIHFVCMDWRHMREVLHAGFQCYEELKNLCVWTKTNGGMGSLYRSQHELIFVFKHGKKPHINNVELGRFGRNRTNVWPYAGMNTFHTWRDEALALHPTVKPTALVADAILDCSHRGGLVLDAFSGSGTTLLAAAQTGRHGYGIEIDPLYCDVTLRRMRQAGFLPIHLQTGTSFDELEHRTSSKKGEAA